MAHTVKLISKDKLKQVAFIGLFLLISFSMQAKDSILYVFDPMCGWCYGFSNIIKQASQEYQDDFEFTILSGGMVVGEREGPIGDFADYILSAYKRVEELSGATFGEPYLNQLKTKSIHTSSVIPSIALEVFKSYQPQLAISFASDLQKAYYLEGLDLRQDSVYIGLIQKYNLPEKEFLEKLHSEEFKEKAFAGFQESAQLGVQGYPAVIGIKDGKYYMLSNGFTDYKNLTSLFEKLKSL
jgi:putative protein-disulfide isomerase